MAIMLTVRGAIEKRRSIRKYKPDPVPQEFILIAVPMSIECGGYTVSPLRAVTVFDGVFGQ